MTKQILENILIKYDEIVYKKMETYSQFTIDFISDNLQDFDDTESLIDDFTGSLIYRIENIITIIKNGVDKDFFTQLKNDINENIKI